MNNVMNELSARYAFVENDGTVVTVGFADQQYDTKDCVLLQRTLKPSKGDIARGWDHIHIMVSDQLRSSYGGVEEIGLWQDHADITLAPDTASQVRAGTVLRVDLSADVANLAEVREMLKLLCGNYAKLTVHF